MPRLLSRAEVAEELEVTIREINNLVKEGLPRVLQGKKVRYPSSLCNTWYRDRAVRQIAADPSNPKTRIADLQARKLEVEARRGELELAREQGELVTIDYLEQQVQLILQQLRSKLRNVPGQYATTMVGIKTVGDAQLLLQKLVVDVMTVLADSGGEAELDEEVANGGAAA